MRTFLLPALLILVILVGWLIVRSRGRRWRFLSAAVAIGTLTGILAYAGVTPLLTGGSVPAGAEGHWLRCVGVGWWVIASRMATAGVRLVLERDARSREARITSDLLSGLIYLGTVLIVLNFVLLLPVGGVIATSGVVAVVIGLALQNTLSDVFSGIAVGIERPFNAGDRITLADGIEGIVIEINWRSIRIQTDGEDIATIPNSVVAKAHILNRNVPTKRRSAHVLITCSVAASPELVLELLRRAAMLCSIILPTPKPAASMTRLGERTNTFAIDYFVADTPTIAPSRTALLSQVHRQLRYAGIIREIGAGTPDDPGGFAAVNELPIFAGLSAEHRAMLAGSLQRRLLREGDLVFAKGADADELIVVAAGVIDIFEDAGDAASEILRRAGPGEAIGDIGLIAGEARPYTARAATAGILFILARGDLLALIDQDKHLAEELERSASEHLAYLRRPEEHDSQTVERTPNFMEVLHRHLRDVVG